MASDVKGLTQAKYHQVEDCDPITEDKKTAVRKVICGFATDAVEATDFMKMLGVHPSQNDDDVPRTGMTNFNDAPGI